MRRGVAVAGLMGILGAAACGAESGSGPGGENPVLAGGSTPTVAPGCQVKPGPDVPDDDFADSNCDGIDGDLARAVFVAPGGDDGALGSAEHPLKTLAKGIERAQADGKDVYVCNGTYNENVVVRGKGVSVFAGFECVNGWRRTTERAVVTPAAGIPLEIRDVSAEIRVERFRFTAPDAKELSGSSIGVFVVDSPKVTLDHLDITAGRGNDAIAPTAPVALTTAAQTGADGHSLVATSCSRNTPALIRPDACRGRGNEGGVSTGAPACQGQGGHGGRGGNAWQSEANEPGASGAPTATGGVGAFGVGAPGANGANGLDGAPAKSGVGSLTATGYAATNRGEDGTPGAPGGGGAGGAGGVSRFKGDVSPEYYVGGGGGEGGYGGCGGAAAKGSEAGGASIGIALVNSPIHVSRSLVTTREGGKGGGSIAGAMGQPGGAAGKGGTGTEEAGRGNEGGRGGTGGKGGAGGAGGGGPSVGVLTAGAPASLSAVVFNLGAPGKGGGAGAPDGIGSETAVAIAPK